MRTIRGKSALITGASSGIGRALALQLAAEGANLFLVDIDHVGLEDIAAAARMHAVEVTIHHCDLSSSKEITACTQRVLAEWGTLDILVNNAGICYYGPTLQMHNQQWDRLMHVNLLAPLQLTRELLPTLCERPEAHILNVASMYGLVTTARCNAYHVSKFGLVGFSEALRTEFGRLGLGVTALCPGYVKTNLFESMERPAGKEIPQAPAWLSSTAEHVAAKGIRAIYRNQGLVLVGLSAHVLYALKKHLPNVLDWVQHIGRARKVRQKEEMLLRKSQEHDVSALRKAA